MLPLVPSRLYATNCPPRFHVTICMPPKHFPMRSVAPNVPTRSIGALLRFFFTERVIFKHRRYHMLLGTSGSVGNIWSCLRMSGSACQRLGVSRSLWKYLGASGNIYEGLEGPGGASGNPWERLERLGICGSVWDCLGGVWTRLGVSRGIWQRSGSV